MYDSQYIRFASIVAVTIFGGMLVLSVRGTGTSGTGVVLIGVATLFMSTIISGDLNLTEENTKSHLFWWDDRPQKEQVLERFPIWGKLWTLATGSLCITLGMILTYRPGLIFVRNRLPFDYPYPVWRSDRQEITSAGANLIPPRSMLSDRERAALIRYRLVLVMIDGKRYLVGKNEMVPEGCTIIRTREGGSICGV